MKKYNITISNSCYDSNADYHSKQSISASGLKEISKTSPSAYLKKEWQETEALAIGTAIHTIILEPEKFSDEIYVMPDLNLRTKAGKEEKQEHIKNAENKTIISETNYELVQNARDVFAKNKKAVNLLKDAEIEKFWFIGISKDKNPKVEIFGFTQKHIDLGRWQWQEAFDRWSFYKETGVCPGEYWNDFDNEIKLI